VLTGRRCRAAAFSASLALLGAGLARAGEPDRATTAGPPPPAATVAGVPIALEAVEEQARAQLIRVRAEEYGIRRKVLEEMVTNALLDKEAASRKVSRDELVRSQVEATVPPVSDDEVRATWARAAPRLPDIGEPQGLARTRALLNQRAINLRKGEYVRALAERWGAKLLLDPVRVGLAGMRGLSVGPAEAPITVAEFADFTCPHCARGNPGLKKLLEAYPGKVRLVAYDLPLPSRPEAPKAAEAARCAHEQGRYWEMRDTLFAHQEALATQDLKRYAREVGLNGGDFDQCLDSSRHAADWDAVRATAAAHGATGTPTYFVNGRPVFGAVPFEYFSVLVEEELGRFVLSSFVPMQGPPAPAAGGVGGRPR
jgi:predicted DsbA family dithiol-disulfide isomerase